MALAKARGSPPRAQRVATRMVSWLEKHQQPQPPLAVASRWKRVRARRRVPALNVSLSSLKL